MNLKQKEWADWVIRGKTPTEAYLLCFPNASKKTASNKGGMFSKIGEIRGYIEEQSAKINDIVNSNISIEVSKGLTSTILTVAKKRELLSKIASGKLTDEKIIVIDGKIKRIKCPANLSDRMKAIELDNRMTGDNVQAKPNQVAKAQEVEKLVVVEDNTPDYGKPNSSS